MEINIRDEVFNPQFAAAGDGKLEHGGIIREESGKMKDELGRQKVGENGEELVVARYGSRSA